MLFDADYAFFLTFFQVRRQKNVSMMTKVCQKNILDYSLLWNYYFFS